MSTFAHSVDSSFEDPSIYVAGSDGPITEWTRENAIRLEEKEKKERAMLSQIIEEADEYKVEFYKKRVVTCQNNKANNRERELLFVANQNKFHDEADKNYWKAIAKLLPNEVLTIETRKGKKDREKKPSVVVIQGPKPGKPTDLLRMRRILLKLKHNAPDHLKPAPAAPAPSKDTKTSDVAAPSQAVAVATPTGVVAAA
ncbi:hypothetical protein ACOSQ2_032566 [Xanthoceras sorbifolium]|uniref:Clathrin light chain n=1 Tax=Xanthoceras sorbifolium TaxID=99658 RepID=A0ABQ8H4W5_9ROSI|nr:hypothetical protein JRO89_XS14G0107200 [Xanthoceras sorbifolium]